MYPTNAPRQVTCMRKSFAALLLAVLVLTGCAASPAFPSPPEETPLPSVPAQTPEPEPTPDPIEVRAMQLLQAMTPEEKVWQLIMLRPEAFSGDGAAVVDAEQITETLCVGGLILSANNLISAEQTEALLAGLQTKAKTPLLLAVDEEGGSVARVGPRLGTTTLEPMFRYRSEGAAAARANAEALATDIAALGFNVDFAPVADVWTNPQNTVIGERAYSDDPVEAAELVAAAVEGFHAGGVAATLKHFPGHGDTQADSHNGSAYADKTLAELERCELLPFLSGIAAGAQLIMTGHITMTAIDPERPATLSEAVITGLLREKLGYEGVVVTDALEMRAITDHYGTDAAVQAIAAGCDLLLIPAEPEAAVQAILQQISEERINACVLRILRLKLNMGLLPVS